MAGTSKGITLFKEGVEWQANHLRMLCKEMIKTLITMWRIKGVRAFEESDLILSRWVHWGSNIDSGRLETKKWI